MTRKRAVAWVLAYSVLLAACEDERGMEPTVEGWFSATVHDAGAKSYQGSGIFFVPESYDGAGNEVWSMFVLSSDGNLGTNLARLSIQSGYRTEIPAAGTYAVGYVDDQPAPFAGHFEILDGDSVRYYMARGGEVTFTESTDDLMAGTFRFEAFGARVCLAELVDPEPGTDGPRRQSCVSRDRADWHEIEIEGSFSALPRTN